MEDLLLDMKNLLLDKIREAEQCDDPDISEEYLTGYINGLKMGLTIADEQGAMHMNKCSDKSVSPEHMCIQKLPHTCSPDDDITDFDEAHCIEWMERHPYGYYNNEHDYGTGDEDE